MESRTCVSARSSLVRCASHKSGLEHLRPAAAGAGWPLHNMRVGTLPPDPRSLAHRDCRNQPACRCSTRLWLPKIEGVVCLKQNQEPAAPVEHSACKRCRSRPAAENKHLGSLTLLRTPAQQPTHFSYHRRSLSIGHGLSPRLVPLSPLRRHLGRPTSFKVPVGRPGPRPARR